jgi:hypothetical protein
LHAHIASLNMGTSEPLCFADQVADGAGANMISCAAATRPWPSRFFLHSVWDMTACGDSDNMARTISFSGRRKNAMIGQWFCHWMCTGYRTSGRFRRLSRRANGFQVPHLAHQNGVRVFAQGGRSAAAKLKVWEAHLALIDQTLLGLVRTNSIGSSTVSVAKLGFHSKKS